MDKGTLNFPVWMRRWERDFWMKRLEELKGKTRNRKISLAGIAREAFMKKLGKPERKLKGKEK